MTRPFENECDDDFLPVAGLDEKEGVMRPFRVDATEDGRDVLPWLAVGAESLFAKMKIPQLGGHTKYCFLQMDNVIRIYGRTTAEV